MKVATGISSRVNAAALPQTFRPQLTSIVDVMTFLLFFLIKSFSVEGTVITPSPDLVLPVSASPKEPHLAATIEITKNALVADGRIIVENKAFVNRDELLIPRLYEWMQAEKSKIADTVKNAEVLIQSDRDVEYSIVKKVMFTCSKAGFSDFSILTIKD